MSSSRSGRRGSRLRAGIAVAALIVLGGCVAYPGDYGYPYYGAAPYAAYPAYAYAAPPVVVGGFFGSCWNCGWGGGWRRPWVGSWGGRGWGGGGPWRR